MKKKIIGAVLIACIIGGYHWWQEKVAVPRFNRALYVAIQQANQDVTLQQAKVQSLYRKINAGVPLTSDDTKLLRHLVKTYQADQYHTLQAQVSDLLAKVRPVPFDFVWGQAMMRTGQGHRYRQSPFGTYAWDKGKYKIQKFSNLYQAVQAFMKDINTLPALNHFRVGRQHLNPAQTNDMRFLGQLLPQNTTDERAYFQALQSVLQGKK